MPHGLRTTFSLLPRHAHVSSSFVGYWATLVGLTPRVSLLPAPLAGPARAQAATSRGAARTILQRNSAPSVAGHRPADEARAQPRAASPQAASNEVRRSDVGGAAPRPATGAGSTPDAQACTYTMQERASGGRSEMMQQSHSGNPTITTTIEIHVALPEFSTNLAIRARVTRLS